MKTERPEKYKESEILKIDRTDLVTAVNPLIKDPAIRAEDLSTEKLREILLNIKIIKHEE